MSDEEKKKVVSEPPPPTDGGKGREQVRRELARTHEDVGLQQ